MGCISYYFCSCSAYHFILLVLAESVFAQLTFPFIPVKPQWKFGPNRFWSLKPKCNHNCHKIKKCNHSFSNTSNTMPWCRIHFKYFLSTYFFKYNLKRKFSRSWQEVLRWPLQHNSVNTSLCIIRKFSLIADMIKMNTCFDLHYWRFLWNWIQRLLQSRLQMSITFYLFQWSTCHLFQ